MGDHGIGIRLIVEVLGHPVLRAARGGTIVHSVDLVGTLSLIL